METILNGARLCTETPRRVRGYPPHASRACMDMCMDMCTNTYMDARIRIWMRVYSVDGYAICTSMHVHRYPCMCTDTDAWMDACKWVSWWMDAWMDARMDGVRAWCVRGCLITQRANVDLLCAHTEYTDQSRFRQRSSGERTPGEDTNMIHRIPHTHTHTHTHTPRSRLPHAGT